MSSVRPEEARAESSTETEALNQEGFPDAIKTKIYASENELLEDLEEAGLADDFRYIALTPGGRAYRIEMPSIYHETAVKFLGDETMKRCEGSGGRILCMNNFEINFADSPSKFPDLAIFSEARLVRVDDFYEPKTVHNEQLGYTIYVNPDVIIKFSWRNKIQDEIPKFEKQMKEHLEAQGNIKVGFLIKAIPANGKDAYPTKKDQETRNLPLCGFDVYECRANGDPIVESQPNVQYRVGGNEGACLTITDADLGRSPDAPGEEEETYHIPLSALRNKLEQSSICQVKFERKREE